MTDHHTDARAGIEFIPDPDDAPYRAVSPGEPGYRDAAYTEPGYGDPSASAPDGPVWTPPAASAAEPDGPPPRPRRRSRRPLFRSLSSRLVAFVVLLVVVVVGAVGAGTYEALKYFLYNRLDQQLSAVADLHHVANLVNFSEQGNLGANALRAPQTVYATVLTGNGAVYTSPQGNGIAPLTLSSNQRASMIRHSYDPQTLTSSPQTLTATDGMSVRVVAVHGLATQATPRQSVVVLIALSDSDLHRTLGRLIALELIIGGGAVVVALLVTSYGVSFSLRNLRRVTSTAREVTAELSPEGAGLDRRVPEVEDDPESEVGQLAGSMNTLLAAVETQFAARVESEQRMRQFLADASHELRTPLTSIKGYAELARMQKAMGAEDVEDNLARIESEGIRMSKLVEDLLVLARGDRGGEPARELVDVAEVLDVVVSSSHAAFPQRQFVLEPSADLHVLGDHDQLVRVVRNLVTNAAVHTDPSRPIRVLAFADGGGAAVQVVDGGPGLPEEEAAHVFERFWRADKARARVRGGSGLGMAIVQSIVEAHGGRVNFQSSVAAGTTVTVWLPGIPTSPDWDVAED